MPVRPLVLACLVACAPFAGASANERTVVVRERAEATLLDGAFTFKLLRIRGYSIDIRYDGQKHLLKLGDTFVPTGAACTVAFEEISPETRIARFVTDCS